MPGPDLALPKQIAPGHRFPFSEVTRLRLILVHP